MSLPLEAGEPLALPLQDAGEQIVVGAGALQPSPETPPTETQARKRKTRRATQQQTTAPKKVRRGLKYIGTGEHYSHLGRRDLTWSEAVENFGDYQNRKREVERPGAIYAWDPPMQDGEEDE